jgi:hypothetical protein
MHVKKEDNEESFFLIFRRKKRETVTVTSVSQWPFKPIQYYLKNIKKHQHFSKLSNDNDVTVIFFKNLTI